MSQQYVFHKTDAKVINKFGVNISIFGADMSPNIVYEETEKGHMQEWYSDSATQIWYIIKGQGTFVLDGKRHKVSAGDLVVVPPKVKKYYLGKMKMLLITSPKFDPNDEHEVRLINEKDKK
jgi:mannose-6-phosphate isomerase-like protein (cupin superfamily)